MVDLARINGSDETEPRIVEGELLEGKASDFNDCPTPEATDRAFRFLAGTFIQYVQQQRAAAAQVLKAIPQTDALSDESHIP